jgi:hypothetical protein
MDIFDLAKTITKKRDGSVQDFIDFLIIIRRWMDVNYVLIDKIDGNFSVTDEKVGKDNRFIDLQQQILSKPIYHKTNKPTIVYGEKKGMCRYEKIKRGMEEKYGIDMSKIEETINNKEMIMVNLLVKLKVEAENVDDALKWLEELAENEYFEFEVIEGK